MNAPARIPVPVTTEDLWSPEERAHRAAITIHLPNENEFGMGCRAHIAAMRDQASAALSRCSDASYSVLLEVSRQAAAAVYAPMPAKQLVLKRYALAAAMDAARALERAAR